MNRLPLPAFSTLPVTRSPSGIPTVQLSAAQHGARNHFVALQWMQPGERVFRHTHTVEETLLFLSGTGVITLEDETWMIQPESSLFIPAGARHGFVAEGNMELRVVVVFPVPYFAETLFTGEDGPAND
ncbi:MAG: cupin domain-containing protein [Thermomicrobiales bacterium]